MLSATKRHLIKHPVVCDFDMKMWSNMEIVCWPTLLVLNPNGIVIAEFKGEIQANLLKPFLKSVYKYYEKNLINIPLSSLFSLSNETVQTSTQNLDLLSFPTKICFNKSENIIFISDSGNNRVLGVDASSGEVKLRIGSGVQGCENGSFHSASFDWPQGLVYDETGGKLYIADTFNDLIRSADLKTQKVYTLCGVSNRGCINIGDHDLKGGKKGLEQSISSPWDLCLCEKDDCKFLLIACAGTHQIWLYTFGKTLKWWKNLEIQDDTLLCIAGNGKERNKNNSYPMQASFAQPSGLSICDQGRIVYIADAESSAIRSLNLNDGSVKGVCGGDNFQPDNLFAYGNTTGILSETKLQHPLDVKLYDQNTLLVCDTYNNCLKKIDLAKKTSENLDLCDLNEPNSTCVDTETSRLWIADTNNHKIKILNTKNGQISELKLKFLDSVDSLKSNLEKLALTESPIDPRISIFVSFDNFKLNPNAPSSWLLKIRNKNNNKLKYEGSFKQCEQHEIASKKYFRLDNVFIDDDLTTIEKMNFEFNCVYCEEGKGEQVCKMLKKKVQFGRQDLLKSFRKNFNSSLSKGSVLLNIKK